MIARLAAASACSVALVAAGCGSRALDSPAPPPGVEPDEPAQPSTKPGDPADPDPGDEALRCEPDLLAVSLSFAEASGAIHVPGPGKPHLLIIGDSGTQGLIGAVDPETGALVRTAHLPLDTAASDDLEGLAMIGDTLHAITSSGWMRHWQLQDAKWQLVEPAYALAGAPHEDLPLVCNPGTGINCARNYEGLCLRHDARPGPECAGFAASKADGILYCLTLSGQGRLAIDPERTIAVSEPETLTGCDFEPDGPGLWAGTNLFGGSRVYRITGWQDPGAARVREVGALGSGFPEALALAPGGRLYRFADLGGATSLVDRYICE